MSDASSPVSRPEPSSVAAAAAPLLRPAAERFHSQLPWLDSWHTFSFAGHHDRRWMGFGPLRVINDDTIAAGTGFGLHPHRDMEIITVMVEGELEHRDSLGHSQRLRAGEVQWMSAGSGLVHSEINPGPSACRLLQIWIEPERFGTAPVYDQKPFPAAPGWTLLLDPAGAAGALSIQRPVRLWRGRADAAGCLELPALQPGRQVWLQMIAGDLLGPVPLQRGDGLGFAAGALAPGLSAGAAGADLLLFELA